MADDMNSLSGDAVLSGATIEDLELDGQSVLAHFVSGGGADAAKTINFLLGLDSVDRWAVDFGEYNRVDADAMRLRAFIRELEHVVRENTPVLDRLVEQFTQLLAGLTTSRCMVILRYVAQRNEHFIDRLAATLEASGQDDLMISTVRRRLEAFERAQMLGRIFSGARLLRIMQIMGSYRDAV